MAATALSETGNERIAMGGNLPPWEAVFDEIGDLYSEARNWASGGFKIENQEQADQIDALDKALLKKGQEAEALRVEEKRPYDELIDEIQTRYNPFIQKGKGKVDIARSSLKALLTGWRTEQERIKREAAEKARREAEEERRAAKEAMRASSADLEAREQAEQKLAAAAMAEKVAKKADKAASTGLGLRTTWVPKLTDLNAAIKHYWAEDRDSFADLVQQLAQQDVRNGKRSIPGFAVEEVKGAI